MVAGALRRDRRAARLYSRSDQGVRGPHQIRGQVAGKGEVMKKKVIELVKQHKQWLNGKAEKPDLCGTDLSGANLHKANLRWANLPGADLSEANLRWANLSGADLHRANLSGANLLDINLCGANLFEADLRGANLCWADLLETDLREADLREANLHDISLCGANLSGADLRWANLSGADLHRANLSGANLSRANLYGANLRETKGILVIQGTRDRLVLCGGICLIGCESHPIDYWLEHYVEIGKRHNYTPDQIEEYGRHIQYAAKWIERVK